MASCKSCGMNLWVGTTSDSCYTCHNEMLAHTAKSHKPNPNMTKLKLYTCRVIYVDPTVENSWFTVLDVSYQGAEATCVNRLKKINRDPRHIQHGGIENVEITEIEGPFSVGQILHEER